MKRWIAYASVALALLTLSAQAEQIVDTPAGVFVAGQSKTSLVRDGRTVWTGDGVPDGGALAADARRAVVLDPLRNLAALYELADGERTTLATGDTPIGALFFNGALFVLARDSRTVERIDGDARRTATTGSDPAFMRVAGEKLLVYSRGDGRLQLIDPATMRVVRETIAAPFASDLEVDGRTAYLVHPREAIVRQVDLATLQAAGELRVGAVPIDLSLARDANVMSASTLAIADPAARRIWTIEGRQSIAQAFARGFVRGLMGLGLFRGANASFPSGIDRVAWRNGRSIAYDSSSGTLYRVGKKNSVVIANGVAPGAFALTRDGVAWFTGGALRVQQ